MSGVGVAVFRLFFLLTTGICRQRRCDTVVNGCLPIQKNYIHIAETPSSPRKGLHSRKGLHIDSSREEATFVFREATSILGRGYIRIQRGYIHRLHSYSERLHSSSEEATFVFREATFMIRRCYIRIQRGYIFPGKRLHSYSETLHS